MKKLFIEAKIVLLVTLILITQGKSLLENSTNVYFYEVSAMPTIISRSEWRARSPAGPVDPLAVNPPNYVIIHHSETSPCTAKAPCEASVRAIQNFHIDTRKWSDIGYNFLVGEDGNIYEGRGWGKTGAHAPSYNNKSIGICVIGSYQNRTPNNAAIEAVNNLIDYGVSQNKISSDYSLLGHRQVRATDCPGNELYSLIKTWPHWVENP